MQTKEKVSAPEQDSHTGLIDRIIQQRGLASENQVTIGGKSTESLSAELAHHQSLIEHLSSLPIQQATIGGKSKYQLFDEIHKHSRVSTTSGGHELIMNSKELYEIGQYEHTFKVSPQKLTNFVALRVKDLGFNTKPETNAGHDKRYHEIFRRAEELGLKRFPTDAGPHLALHLAEFPLQPGYYDVAMPPIQAWMSQNCFYIDVKPGKDKLITLGGSVGISEDPENWILWAFDDQIE